MSQDFSLLNQNLLQTLEVEIFKFKQHGPPAVRLNIPCKFKEHCKYGKYSCMYSHECFCKYQRNHKKCLNTSCTHQHDLPLEFQLAQVFFSEIMQLSSSPSSPEAPFLASENDFSSLPLSECGRPDLCVLPPETGISLGKSLQNNVKLPSPIHLPPSEQAEQQFSAFSPMFQSSAKIKVSSPSQAKTDINIKPAQVPSIMDTKSFTNVTNYPFSAQTKGKTSESSTKVAPQFQGLSPRNSSPNQSPPPLKQGPKSRISTQTNNSASANCVLTIAASSKIPSSPVFTSPTKNSPANSTTEGKFAALPVAPVAGILYDVVSAANASEYKVSARGNAGEALKRNTDMGDFAYPSFPSMETNFEPVSADPRQSHTAPLNFTPLEEPITHTAATTIPSLSFYASLIPASLSDAPHKPQAKSLQDLPISRIPEQRVKQIPAKISYVPETITQNQRKKKGAEKPIKIETQPTQTGSLNFKFSADSANTEKKNQAVAKKQTTPTKASFPLCASILVKKQSTPYAHTSQRYSTQKYAKQTKKYNTQTPSDKNTKKYKHSSVTSFMYNYWNDHTSQWEKSEVPPVYRPKQTSQTQSSQLCKQSSLTKHLVESNLGCPPQNQRSLPNQQVISILKKDQPAISKSDIPPTLTKTSQLKSMLNIAVDESNQWGILAETSSESDDALDHFTYSRSAANHPQKKAPTLKYTEDTPVVKASLMPLRKKHNKSVTQPQPCLPFLTRAHFQKERGSACMEKSFPPPRISSSNQKHSILIRKKIPTSCPEQNEAEISSNSANNSRNQISDFYANLGQSLDERFEALLAAIKRRNNSLK